MIVSGITAAEYVSCLLGFLLYCWLNKKQEQRKKGQGSVMRRLMRIALPDGVGSVARSILLTVEHLLIPIGFRKSGASAQTSMATYGVIHGMTLQLLLYPSALLTSLSSLLVPELAEQHAQKNNTRIALITARVLKMTMLFAVGTAGILYAYATPLSMRVYGNADAAEYIRLLAPLIPVMYLDMTVDGILKGLDQQFYSMRYNLLDSGLCVLLVYLLIPRYGVKGYIFILFASEILNFYLSIGRLIRVTQVKLELMEGVVQPLFCVLAAFFMVRLAFGNLGAALGETGSLVLWIGLNAAIYLCFLRWVGSLTRADTQWIQGLLSRNKTKTLGVQTKLQNKAAKPRS